MTADDWHALRRLGCDPAQGYYLSRPVPPTEFLADTVTRNRATPRTEATVR